MAFHLMIGMMKMNKKQKIDIELGEKAMQIVRESLENVRKMETKQQRSLRRIREWEDEHKWSLGFWLQHCAKAIMAEGGNVQLDGGVLLVATSGNNACEKIVDAMRSNVVLWQKAWRGSLSGGAHIFATSKFDPAKTQIRIVIEDK